LVHVEPDGIERIRTDPLTVAVANHRRENVSDRNLVRCASETATAVVASSGIHETVLAKPAHDCFEESVRDLLALRYGGYLDEFLAGVHREIQDGPKGVFGLATNLKREEIT
jgi:hypothetical protein